MFMIFAASLKMTLSDFIKKIEWSLRVSRSGTGNPTQTILKSRARLALVLNWMRRYGAGSQISKIFGVSKSTLSREIKYILPKLRVTLQESIRWPKQISTHPFEGVMCAIDCAHHPRTRVHPRQADWYRRDKGFGILAQVVVPLEGNDIYDVQLLQGHNNDQGALHITQMDNFISEHQIKMIGDLGYWHARIVTPEPSYPSAWRKTQMALRSVVETVIGLVKNWGIAGSVFRGSPELQALAVMVAYQLTAIRLKELPLRPKIATLKYVK